jgi:hypothetical protein
LTARRAILGDDLPPAEHATTEPVRIAAPRHASTYVEY